MLNTYGRDLADIFSGLESFDSEVSALPTKLQSAENFKTAMLLEYSRISALYGVLQDIYNLNDLEKCSGAQLDLYGSDYGLLRGKYSDEEFRNYIRLWATNNRLNAGTIPDIRAAVRLAFPQDMPAVEIVDARDGSVRIEMPTTLFSEIFSTTGANLTAAGIELIITLNSAFVLGCEFSGSKEHVKDRDDHIIKLRKDRKLTSGKRFKHYGARIDIGGEIFPIGTYDPTVAIVGRVIVGWGIVGKEQ